MHWEWPNLNLTSFAILSKFLMTCLDFVNTIFVKLFRTLLHTSFDSDDLHLKLDIGIFKRHKSEHKTKSKEVSFDHKSLPPSAF